MKNFTPHHRRWKRHNLVWNSWGATTEINGKKLARTRNWYWNVKINDEEFGWQRLLLKFLTIRAFKWSIPILAAIALFLSNQILILIDQGSWSKQNEIHKSKLASNYLIFFWMQLCSFRLFTNSEHGTNYFSAIPCKIVSGMLFYSSKSLLNIFHISGIKMQCWIQILTKSFGEKST